MLRLHHLIWLCCLAGLLSACAAPATVSPAPSSPADEATAEPVELAAARAALARSDYLQAVELLAAPTSPEHVALLARARAGLAQAALSAAPAEPGALRTALDQVGLALALRPADRALQDELLGLERAIVSLLAAEEARTALAAAADADPARRLGLARTLAERAAAAAVVEPHLPGAEQLAAAGLLAAATSYEQAGDADPVAPDTGWRAARQLCERAQALSPDEAGQACLERLSQKLDALVAGQDTATPTARAPTATARPVTTTRPTSRPAAPAFSVVQRRSFEGSGNSGQFASCIDIQILGPAGPLSGAVVGINNGEHSYQNQTDANGYTGRCGLGASTWSVVLFWTPTTGSVRGVTTTVYLSGSPEQRAAVVIQGR